MEIEKLYKYLPYRLYLILRRSPRALLESTTEIRLRTGLPVSLSSGKGNVFINADGRPCTVSDGIRIDKDEMDECISRLTGSSFYAYEEAIKRGYVPLEDGYRAGVCGDAVFDGKEIKTFSRITSVCLRVSRFFPSAASDVCRRLRTEGLKGVLVFSPPGMGKTTYLRSCAYLLSSGNKPFRVGIADERSELFVPEMKDCVADVVRECPKKQAIDLLTRTMSPEIIVCDEISDAETDGLIASQNSGVCLIASCHGSSLDGIMRRPHVRALAEKRVFELFVRLYRTDTYGSEVMTL